MSRFTSHRRAKPTVEGLEDRAVPATNLIATLSGSTVVFQDVTGGDDSVALSRDASGNLQHDLFTQGVAGFESNIDLDSQTPGIQSAKLNTLQVIEIDAGLGNDSLTVKNLGKTSALEVDLESVDSLTIKTGSGNDKVDVGPHAGHLDVEYAGKEFHIVGTTELILDTQSGNDSVTVSELTAAVVPADIDIVKAETVQINLGDGDNKVTVGPHEGHLDLQLDSQTVHVIKAQELILDLQGGNDSIIVGDLSSAKVLADFDIVNSESVTVQTGAGADRAALSAHQGHLDVEFTGREFHVIGAAAFVLDTQGGLDTLTVNDLTSLITLTDIDVEGAEQVNFLTGAADDVVELGAHQGHFDVDLAGREFHVVGAAAVNVNTQGGKDEISVSVLSAITAPALTLNGGKGSDIYQIATTTGQLTIVDNSGTDTLDFSSFDTGINLDLASTQAQAIGLGVTLRLVGELDNVIGSAFADIIFGNLAGNAIDGRNGSDTLHGRGGNDLLAGDVGDDSLFGNGGDDWLLGSVGADSFDGGTGKNFVSDPDTPV